MSEQPEDGDIWQPHTEDEAAWIRDHLPELRRTAEGQRILFWYLGSAIVVGLAAQILGYELRLSALSEPFGLIADLIYALGLSLWTGVVVTIFVQVLPEIKRRQVARALDSYEAAFRRTSPPAAPRDATTEK